MAKRGACVSMSNREKALGGVLLGVYLAVLPYASKPAFALAEKLLGISLGETARNAIYYYVLFALTVIVFWGYLVRSAQALADRLGAVLAAAGLGLVAFYGHNELTGRLLGLVTAGQTNLNDASIAGRIGASPWSTILIVVFLAPVVEETLFRGYLFGSLREVDRALSALAEVCRGA